jgi:hypothetical protein
MGGKADNEGPDDGANLPGGLPAAPLLFTEPVLPHTAGAGDSGQSCRRGLDKPQSSPEGRSEGVTSRLGAGGRQRTR